METPQLSRGQFLKQLGLSSAALMSFYCLGTGLTSCSKDESEPTPIPPTVISPSGNSGVAGTITGNAIDFTVDLTNTNYAKLKTQGEFVYVGDIIIANAKGTFVALSKACTHQGTTINYRSGTNDFNCPNHGSIFRTDGSVQRDPATRSLTVYKTELLNNNNSLRVKA